MNKVLSKYPNITLARAVTVLVKMGYAEKDDHLLKYSSIFTKNSDPKISYIGTDVKRTEISPGKPKKENQVIINSDELLRKYDSVFDRNETLKLYLEMDKNEEFVLVDKISNNIFKHKRFVIQMVVDTNETQKPQIASKSSKPSFIINPDSQPNKLQIQENKDNDNSGR